MLRISQTYNMKPFLCQGSLYVYGRDSKGEGGCRGSYGCTAGTALCYQDWSELGRGSDFSVPFNGIGSSGRAYNRVLETCISARGRRKEGRCKEPGSRIRARCPVHNSPQEGLCLPHSRGVPGLLLSSAGCAEFLVLLFYIRYQNSAVTAPHTDAPGSKGGRCWSNCSESLRHANSPKSKPQERRVLLPGPPCLSQTRARHIRHHYT